MHAYRVSHPRGYGSVREARRALLAFAEECGFHAPTLWDIESAAGEALANAAEHGDHEDSSGFDVSATFDGESLVIEVKDHGTGFDCSSAFANEIPDCAGHRGFGIYLMRKLMDDVVYSERGSCIQLIKRLDARPLTSSR